MTSSWQVFTRDNLSLLPLNALVVSELLKFLLIGQNGLPGGRRPLQFRLAVPARLENRLLTLLFLWHNLSP